MRFTVALIFLALLSAAKGKESPTALQIFDAALAKFRNDRAALHSWQYHQTLTTHQLDAHGKVVARGTWKSIVRPGDPQPLEYTFSHMEGTISFFKKGAAAPSGPSKKSGARTPQPTEKAEKNQAEAAVDAVRKYQLRDRYDWKRLPDEDVKGDHSYVIAFTPKTGQRVRSREERFFSLLGGRLWVNQSDDSVVKAEAALQAPCSLFWIIARVTTFKFTYELGSAPGGNRLCRPSKATATTVVTFPFISIRQKHWHSTYDYEPRATRKGI